MKIFINLLIRSEIWFVGFEKGGDVHFKWRISRYRQEEIEM